MLYLIIPVLICGVDLFFKHYIECNVKGQDKYESPCGHPRCPKSMDNKYESPCGHPRCPKSMDNKYEILNGRILIRKSHNTGAMMNLLDKHQKLVSALSLGVFICMAMYYGYLMSKKGMHLLKVGLSFLIGGAISNVYDRLVRKYVVDYFSFNTKNKKIKKVVFNIADIFIFLGSFLVILWNVFHKS